ncbi:unnamed protein product [Prorocentrum cordatum]|uniref:Uncharacterized protein n=1 Tax=Prorocentrum cordatum TaxID=2364126 RepID=A0ABN9S4D6_9DINO|nr:unnamed protein product [Polarella glacialis]
MATVRPLEGEAVALLAPLVKAAAAGAAEGGGGRRQVAAAVASALRAGAALLAPCQASEVGGGGGWGGWRCAVKQLGGAHLTEMVKAGRAGVQPRPSVASRAFRGWAQRAEFGGGPHDVLATARDARRRGRGRRRGAGDAESAGAADAADAATAGDLEAVKEQLEEGREARAPLKPVEKKKKGEMKKLVFQCAPGYKATDEVKAVASAMGESTLVNTRINNGETKIDSEKLKDANAPKVAAQLVTDCRKVERSHMGDGVYDGVAVKVGDDDVFAECSVASLSVDPGQGQASRGRCPWRPCAGAAGRGRGGPGGNPERRSGRGAAASRGRVSE